MNHKDYMKNKNYDFTPGKSPEAKSPDMVSPNQVGNGSNLKDKTAGPGLKTKNMQSSGFDTANEEANGHHA